MCPRAFSLTCLFGDGLSALGDYCPELALAPVEKVLRVNSSVIPRSRK